MSKQTEALKLALVAQRVLEAWDHPHGMPALCQEMNTLRKALAEQPAQQQQEPVGWISVNDELPKAVRGISYNANLTDVVLVRHSDRPDYPITAHAVVGEGLGAGVAIPTDGASEHPEIAWYSASSNLNNPFDLKNDDYERYLPKVFGSKITHWKPIDTPPPASKPLTNEMDRQAAQIEDYSERNLFITGWLHAEAAHGITGEQA